MSDPFRITYAQARSRIQDGDLLAWKWRWLGWRPWDCFTHVGRAAGKDASRMRAMELFPTRAELFKRAKDDGRADAALIAYWYITKNA